MHHPNPFARPRRVPANIHFLRGFTLTELLTVIAIIGVLAAILIPTVGKVRRASQNSACASNLRQIGVALTGYSADNRGALPGHDLIQDDWQLAYGLNRGAGATYWVKSGKPTRDLCSHLGPYLGISIDAGSSTGTVPSFICPAAASEQTGVGTSYYIGTSVRMNDGSLRRPIGLVNNSIVAQRRSVKRVEIASPARAVALFDADNEYLPTLSQSTVTGAPASAVHGTTRNVLYFDGHVAAVNKDINPQEQL
ncbi:MAG: N-terminal cleavage protein [Rariglobus sp.]|jgi:prepilin-type N-terminal cleavage/methylation domain-containing protein/prepilin-type processing-associated H-X9-DG protein|nr:N-terminal cleavage protein [Rariglobus sp.]